MSLSQEGDPVRSDVMITMDESGPMPGNARYVNYLPQVSLPFDMPGEPLAIAEMADLFGVSHRTLHFYEEKHLIAASRAGSMRVYDTEQIQRMAVINACREIGIPVAVVQELMEELTGVTSQEEADAIFHSMLSRRKRELTADISHIHRQMQQIETMLVPESEGTQEVAKPAIIILNDMEKQCLALMADGYSAPRIARSLNMDFETLRDMEDDIVRKFQATNRFQAVAKAVLLGMVPN